MNLQCWMVVAALIAAPLMAAPAEEPKKPATEDAAAAQTPPEPAPEPTTGELGGRIDSITEAFTEAKSMLDVLSRLKISGYLQAQYVRDERSSNELTGATATRNLDQFSVRRGRVKFTYQLSPTSRFVLQPDVTSSGVTLKDGYVELTEPWTTWKNTATAGQFNWPFGFEIMYSSSSREMPERSLVVRTLFPGERDRGVMLSGADRNGRFNYRLAVVNGTGTSGSSDLNKRKDVVGRAGASFGPLDVGLSAYRGSDLVALTGLTRGAEFEKRREGVDVQWITPVPGLGIRGEYIRGRQPPAAGAPQASAASADVSGWYAYAIQNVGTRHQFVLRLDQYDPNNDVDDNATRTLGGSYIFHWDAASKVMLAYEQPRREAADPADNLWTLRYQYSF